MVFVPNMHTRFVSDFDAHIEVAEQCVGSADDVVFGVVAEVGVVEVEEVVVVDPRLRSRPSRWFQTVWNTAPAVRCQSERPSWGARSRIVVMYGLVCRMRRKFSSSGE